MYMLVRVFDDHHYDIYEISKTDPFIFIISYILRFIVSFSVKDLQ